MTPEREDEPELTPCPFCSSADIHLEHTNGWPYFECHECGGGGPCYAVDEKTAKELWNTRALPPQPTGDVWRDPVTGKTLKELSDQASPGQWLQGDMVAGTTVDQWQEFGAERCQCLALMAVDANFICALVNAYRSGALIDARSANSRIAELREAAKGQLVVVNAANARAEAAEARVAELEKALADAKVTE